MKFVIELYLICSSCRENAEQTQGKGERKGEGEKGTYDNRKSLDKEDWPFLNRELKRLGNI